MRTRIRAIRLVLALLALAMGEAAAFASERCPAEQADLQMPADPAACAALAPVIENPSALPLDQYEAKLGTFIRNFCHRDRAAGWRSDKTVRDTGPFTARLENGHWVGEYHGTHAPVVIWYSPSMLAWLHANRPEDATKTPAHPAPVPDGAVMVKEMYPAPAAACADVDITHLRPTSGAAVMVRDSRGAFDGWFWGWFGWSGWAPDWPATAANAYPNMGFGQYCTNCHASARDSSTFASLRNIEGEPGEFLHFLSQFSFLDAFRGPPLASFAPALSHDAEVGEEAREAPPPVPPTAATLGRLLPPPGGVAADAATVSRLPAATYDSAPVPPRGPQADAAMITSDQCVGCHTAGGTGLQFDMTAPQPDGKLLNLSPYGGWSSSPMGLAGRDPVFYAQLASEAQSFHPELSAVVQDTCSGCHGILGQRQFKIDSLAAAGECRNLPIEAVQASPFPAGNPGSGLAHYGALARDGVSCAACHHMVVGQAAAAKVMGAPQNACLAARQDLLNPHSTGFARTFTGSFALGSPDTMFGPFDDPRTRPMLQALGIKPVATADMKSSEVCGTCHTVHLPVLRQGKVIGFAYEQATYAEWAFSAYRTGATPDGPLPGGAGADAQSCQSCHMPDKDAGGHPFISKIASIQERSNFPEAENVLPAADIDLPEREGFAQHLLVGLNVFLIRMAAQFPDVLGIRTTDPMLAGKGVPPLAATEQAMLDQAAHRTAEIAVSGVARTGSVLTATIAVTNRTGHKFPSGVGFRRAFINFRPLDANGAVLWESGRTDPAGAIVDQAGKPIAGEYWWNPDCAGRADAAGPAYQPHWTLITRQDQAQIFQELVSAPAPGAEHCDADGTGGQLTTSFLSICGIVKDNRLLPRGMLPLAQREAIAAALGAGPELAHEAGPAGVGDDPDYQSGGGDHVQYRIDTAPLAGRPAAIEARLYYQATPPFYLQDRFCTAKGPDAGRLYYLASRLDLAGTPAEGWKLEAVTTGRVALPQ